MTFEEFTAKVVKEIRDYLPPEYENAEIELREVQKLNRTYQALIIRKEGSLIAPSIDLSGYFEAAEQGIEMPEILNHISEAAQIEPPGFDLDQFTDYDSVKDSLFIRISDTEANKDLLKEVPHKDICGLAVTCHVLVDKAEGFTGTVLVTKGLLEKYGVSFEQLYQDAVENSQKLFPAQVRSVESMMMELSGMEMGQSVPQEFSEQVKEIDLERDGMAVITNREGTNGAAVIFYPGVLQSIGDQVKENYFILPSSLHEVIIVADNGEMELSSLQLMVKEINATQVAPKDKLSDTVYHYDSKEHRFEKAVDFERRQKEREMDHSDRKFTSGSKAKARKEKDWER